MKNNNNNINLFLQNLTEFNTAHNRRISMLGIADEDLSRNSSGKRKKRSITFNDEVKP